MNFFVASVKQKRCGTVEVITAFSMIGRNAPRYRCFGGYRSRELFSLTSNGSLLDVGMKGIKLTDLFFFFFFEGGQT